MYKKYAMLLLMVNVILGVAFITVKEREMLITAGNFYGRDVNEAVSVGASNVECISVARNTECVSIVRNKAVISGNQPLLTLQSVEKEYDTISEEEKWILCKIVEAEAGTEDRIGKILVANVVLNRLENERFPDTVEGVVFQENDGVAQFSPVANGRYESAKPKEETIEAVEAALTGEDYSEGALYFMARKHADSENVEWFDNSLDKVVTHGGHEFYK